MHMHSSLVLLTPQSLETAVIALGGGVGGGEGRRRHRRSIHLPAAVVLQKYVSMLAANTEEEDALQLELYYKYLQAQAEGFDGAFDEYISKEIAQPVIDSLPEEDIPEEVSAPALPTKHNYCIFCTMSCLAVPILNEAKGKLG